MKKIVLVLLLAVLPAIWLEGCTSVEQAAYKTVVASKAFLDSVKAKHPECAAGQATTLCADLRKATAAKDLLIDAGEAYCGGQQFDAGGPCQPPAKGTPQLAQMTAKLKAALAGYNQAEKDMRGLL